MVPLDRERLVSFPCCRFWEGGREKPFTANCVKKGDEPDEERSGAPKDLAKPEILRTREFGANAG
jgi:hypothetical protein